MAEQLTPYIDRNPGDLITAEDWDDVQKKIKEDIAAKISTAIGAIEKVPYAENAGKLSGQTTEELTKDIIDKALAQIPSRSGYRRLFKVLKFGEEDIVIKHDLHEMPLVDVYQLDYFQVLCSEDDEKYESWVTFYLYHSSEKKLRFKREAKDAVTASTIRSTSSRPTAMPIASRLPICCFATTSPTQKRQAWMTWKTTSGRRSLPRRTTNSTTTSTATRRGLTGAAGKSRQSAA